MEAENEDLKYQIDELNYEISKLTRRINRRERIATELIKHKEEIKQLKKIIAKFDLGVKDQQ